MNRFILALSIGGLLWMPVIARAQTPTTAGPSASAPGKSSVKVDMVPSLFVMNAHGASLQGQSLAVLYSQAGGVGRDRSDSSCSRSAERHRE